MRPQDRGWLMDISDVPPGKLTVLVQGNLVFVSAPGHPPLVLSAAQVEAVWKQTTELRDGVTATGQGG